MQNKQILERGIVYEIVVFAYAMLLTWIFVGSPLKSLLLTITIALTKLPLYYVFHCQWRDK